MQPDAKGDIISPISQDWGCIAFELTFNDQDVPARPVTGMTVTRDPGCDKHTVRLTCGDPDLGQTQWDVDYTVPGDDSGLVVSQAQLNADGIVSYHDVSSYTAY